MLEYKKISNDTVKCMKDAVGSTYDYYDNAVTSIGDLLPDGEIHILNSANSCLLTVCEALVEPILVTDEGSWNGFIKSCSVFGKNVEYFTTDNGVINIEELENYFKEHEVKSLYITSLCGYSKEQPIDEIYRLCNVYDVLLIVDISPSLGNEKLTRSGDIQIASTGSPKIVNIENGGFINNITKKITLNKHLLKTLKADNITCAGIINEIKNAKEIEERIYRINQHLKEKLYEKLGDHVLFVDGHGLNTIILCPSKSKAKRLAYNIRQHLDVKDNKNIISVGPSYNRIKKACVIIEVKNLDYNSLTKKNMDKIADTVIKEYNLTFNTK